MTAQYACDHAWIEEVIVDRVVLQVEDGHFTDVAVEADTFDEVARTGTHLPGVTLPGLVNAHSHAFHRALRGRTHGDGGSFWEWREQMYAIAASLDPDSYHALATAVYAEMALAGITTVGEFHYLHHAPEGRRYTDPNAMGSALLAAAADAGVRITLLDALYLTAAVGDTVERPRLHPVQQRFSDGSVSAWADRIGRLQAKTTARIGAAIHSVRAVPAAQLGEVAAAVGNRRVLHAHVAEQPAEVEATVGLHDRTPVGLLQDHGVLGPSFTAVHAIWVDDADIAHLAFGGSGVCVCPTTERDLGDGVAPADRLLAAGVPLSLGTDQHAATDMLEEARAVELDLRLVRGGRGLIKPEVLLRAATTGGASSLGWHDAGRIARAAPADLCVVGLDGPRLAGAAVDQLAATVVFSATAADVTHTMVAGRLVVQDGRHTTLDVAGELLRTIDAVTRSGVR